MKYVQEVLALARDNTRFTIHVSNEPGSPEYELEIYMRAPTSGKLASIFGSGLTWTVNVRPGPYPSADAAFGVVATALGNFQNAHGGGNVIVSVDNPCNADFIGAAAQEAMLKQNGVNVHVTVNGK
jgi:hypothetical protein